MNAYIISAYMSNKVEQSFLSDLKAIHPYFEEEWIYFLNAIKASLYYGHKIKAPK